MRTLRRLPSAVIVLLGLVAGCYDLDVANPYDNETLLDPDSAVAGIARGFHDWFEANYDYEGAGVALSNVAFQHTEPWAHFGSEVYARIPRVAFVNVVGQGDYAGMTRSWSLSYRALKDAADGLRALDGQGAAATLTADELGAARAFARFVQGLATATLAVFYAQGYVLDETTNPEVKQTPVAYGALMTKALAYLDECARLSAGAAWTLPEAWMRASLTGPELARVARSMKARYRAAGARTPAERDALDWSAIMADVDAGITADLVLDMDDQGGWSNDVLGYGTYSGWSQLGFFIFGMADQSGSYQLWDAEPVGPWPTQGKSHTIDGKPMLIVTPDLRFPRGSTVEAQRLAPGRYFRVNREGDETGNTWARPDRGTWRWSWYKHIRGEEYWAGVYVQPEIRLSEMRLLKAEGLYRTGSWAAATAIVNETRVEAGLNPTDASGTNTSCVPRLPDGRCGDILEMLKWEKRMENTFKGPFGNLWYFDGRGWGDLWIGSILHLPIPCEEATVAGLVCATYGGVGGAGAAARSLYRWNGEG